MVRSILKRLWYLPILLSLSWADVMALAAQSQSEYESTCEPTDYIFIVSRMAGEDSAAVQSWVDALRTTIVSIYDYAAYSCREVLFRVGLIGATADAPVFISFDEPEGQIDVRRLEARTSWAVRREAAGAKFANIASITHPTELRPALAVASSMFAQVARDNSRRQRRLIWLTSELPCSVDGNRPTAIVNGNSPCINEAYYQHYFFGNSSVYSDYIGASSAAAGFEFDYGLTQFLLSDSNLSGATDFSIIFFQPHGRVASTPTWINNILNTVTTSRNGNYISPDAMQGEIGLFVAAIDDLLIEDASNREFLNIEELDQCHAEFVSLPVIDSGLAIRVSGSIVNSAVSITTPNGEVFPMGTPYYFSFRNRPTASGYQVPAQAVTSDRPTGSELHAAIEIDHPLPGRWQIVVEGICDAVEVILSRIDLQVAYRYPETITSVMDQPFYMPRSTDYIEIDVTTGLGTPILVSSAPLSICAQILGPSPRIDELLEAQGCLEFAFVTDGLMRSVRPLPAPTAGTYRVTIEALLEYGDQTLPVFETQIIYYVQ